MQVTPRHQVLDVSSPEEPESELAAEEGPEAALEAAKAALKEINLHVRLALKKKIRRGPRPQS